MNFADLAALNRGGECVPPSDDGETLSGRAGYAGHCDWRLPTIVELRTILD